MDVEEEEEDEIVLMSLLLEREGRKKRQEERKENVGSKKFLGCVSSVVCLQIWWTCRKRILFQARKWISEGLKHILYTEMYKIVYSLDVSACLHKDLIICFD